MLWGRCCTRRTDRSGNLRAQWRTTRGWGKKIYFKRCTSSRMNLNSTQSFTKYFPFGTLVTNMTMKYREQNVFCTAGCKSIDFCHRGCHLNVTTCGRNFICFVWQYARQRVQPPQLSMVFIMCFEEKSTVKPRI